MGRIVKCIKLGREAEGLDFPPYPGELGKRIYNEVSKEAWQGWLKHQTMLVNENRLNLADQRARVDRFDYLDNFVFSPRTTFMIKPRANQTFRVSYNRAYRSPS